MDQPTEAQRVPILRRLPWGIIIAAVFLTVVAIIVHKGQRLAPWWSVIYLSLTAAGLFVVGRWLVGSLWGMIMALTLEMHPVYLQRGLADSSALEGEALKILTLAGVMFFLRRMYSPRNHFLQLLLISLFLTLVGSLAWLTSAHAGWVAALVTLVGLLMGFVLALVKKQKHPNVAPAGIHVFMAAALGVLIPVAALFLILPLSQMALGMREQNMELLESIVRRPLPDQQAVLSMLENTVEPRWDGKALPGMGVEERELWGWPGFWPVLVLMLFGLTRSCWRGWLQWSNQQPPLGWLLTLFVLAVISNYLLDPIYVKDIHFLPLATLAVILPFFGISDWIFGVGERIRLEPPKEEESRLVER